MLWRNFSVKCFQAAKKTILETAIFWKQRAAKISLSHKESNHLED